jgi:hypothetical protein
MAEVSFTNFINIIIKNKNKNPPLITPRIIIIIVDIVIVIVTTITTNISIANIIL